MTYRFRCDCGETAVIETPKMSGPSNVDCTCGLTMYRDYQAEHCGNKHVISISSMEKGLYPYKNVLWGERVESRAHEDHILKQRGSVRDVPSKEAMYRSGRRQRRLY